MKRVLLNVGSLCLGLCVSLLAAEAFVLMTVGEQVKFPRRVVEAPWGLRYNEPGAQYRHKSRDGAWSFRINGQGMRADRDYRHEKPPGVRRVLVVGDSFTVGYEVDVEQTFAMVLERALRHRDLKVEVLNAGVSGYSTAEAALYLERELIKYQPDVVVSAFYENDFADNVRADLFRLKGDTLVVANDRYVPAGRLGNFLNTNLVFSVLSERSNAFAFAKEQLTLLVKRAMEGGSGAQEGGDTSSSNGGDMEPATRGNYDRRLLAAVVNRMYAFLHARNIPLVILSIPQNTSREGLIERFPREMVDFTRPGLAFVSGEHALRPHASTHVLYNRFSLNHWTPIAHQSAGEALASLRLWEEVLR